MAHECYTVSPYVSHYLGIADVQLTKLKPKLDLCLLYSNIWMHKRISIMACYIKLAV